MPAKLPVSLGSRPHLLHCCMPRRWPPVQLCHRSWTRGRHPKPSVHLHRRKCGQPTDPTHTCRNGGMWWGVVCGAVVGEADTPELDQLIMPRLLNVPGLEELVVVVVYVWPYCHSYIFAKHEYF